ncbi:MAG: HlyD family efflux transporter periplasmic adaptor subunit [Proteobacteria bacterium]|nr:HlyD family efflux transporter periplasmic adaptor subunit [Pseudomonadota bacterium]
MLAAALAAAIVLILIVGSYAGSSSARGILAFDAGLARVSSPAAGDVREILVRPGQRVERGTPLIVVSTAAGPGGLATQLAQLGRQIDEIDNQLKIAGTTAASEEQALRDQRRAQLEAAASLRRQQGIGHSQTTLAGQDLARFTRLASQGAANQRQVNQARAELLSRRAEGEALRQRLIDASGRAASLAAQIAQRQLEAERARSLLTAQRAALVSQREDILRADHTVLVAPVAGEVSDVAATVGQHVGAERALVSIVPGGSHLEAWLYAPSNAVGFAGAGQRVKLRFDAFPYQKYGFGEGTVLAVSRAPVDPASVDAAVRPAEPSFLIRVRIEALGSPAIRAEGLRPGMTVRADLVQRRHPLWALILGAISGAVEP